MKIPNKNNNIYKVDATLYNTFTDCLTGSIDAVKRPYWKKKKKKTSLLRNYFGI